MTLFDVMKTGWDVEQAVMNHLDYWLPSYLAEIERQRGIRARSIPMIRAFTSSNQFRKWPDERFPTCVVISPGVVGEPLRDGEGKYRANWAAGVAVVVKGRNKSEVSEKAKLYAAAVRGAIVQHPALKADGEDEFAGGVDWVDETYTDVPVEDERTLGAAQGIFLVEVRDAVNTSAGLITAPDDPYNVPTDWPTVQTVEIRVERLEEEDE